MLAIEDNNERFRTTMCVIQGCMITLGLIQVTLGYTGALAVILRFVTPITSMRLRHAHAMHLREDPRKHRIHACAYARAHTRARIRSR